MIVWPRRRRIGRESRSRPGGHAAKDDEWRDRDPDAFLEDNRRDAHLVEGVSYSVLAGALTRDPGHPVGAVLGDVLVRVPSALGRHRQPERRIPFRVGHVHGGLSPLHLVNHPDLYAHLRELPSSSR